MPAIISLLSYNHNLRKKRKKNQSMNTSGQALSCKIE